MKLALFNTSLGIVLTAWLGSRYFGFGAEEIFRAILGSFLGGWCSLLATTRLESSPRTKRFIHSAWKTWVFHCAVYFGILLLCASRLREPTVLAALILPLLLVTGSAIVAFGPLQDAFVARSQRKARESAHSIR